MVRPVPSSSGPLFKERSRPLPEVTASAAPLANIWSKVPVKASPPPTGLTRGWCPSCLRSRADMDRLPSVGPDWLSPCCISWSLVWKISLNLTGSKFDCPDSEEGPLVRMGARSDMPWGSCCLRRMRWLWNQLLMLRLSSPSSCTQKEIKIVSLGITIPIFLRKEANHA